MTIIYIIISMFVKANDETKIIDKIINTSLSINKEKENMQIFKSKLQNYYKNKINNIFIMRIFIFIILTWIALNYYFKNFNSEIIIDKPTQQNLPIQKTFFGVIPL